MNTPRRRPNDEARTALVNVELIAIEIDTALIAIDRALAGWPEQTPGAAPAEARPPAPCTHCTHIRPCPTHDADLIAEGQVKLTGPERGAAQGDRARIDLERLVDHVRLLAHHARAAADITHHWSAGAISSAEVAEKLALRLKFDAENGKGSYLKARSSEICEMLVKRFGLDLSKKKKRASVKKSDDAEDEE